MLAPPFVLLDDARSGAAPARLYRSPRRIVRADRSEEVAPALAALREAQAEGRHVAGFLAYEAGAAFTPRPVGGASPCGPLMWFGVFDGWTAIEDHRVAALLPDPAGAWVGEVRPSIDRGRYDAQIAEVLRLIVAGDIYQVNLTFQATVRFEGNPLALYAQLRSRAKAGYGALIATGETTLLSLSPESFFTLDAGILTCRPMKGTAARAADPDEDRRQAATLATDAKQRAENLMIVDLMRNDMSRVAAAGSVAVPRLFTVESYPTVHQLTSTVTARLADGLDAVDVIRALFPCGSITGAPKQRAMEVIAAVEVAPRGVYTGAIGRIDADGDAAFNVAIRTLVIEGEERVARMGLGSGIVADSRAGEEWDECLAKAAFVTAGARPIDLVETMAFDPDEGVALLETHLERMKRSADALGMQFDRHHARNELQAATFRLRRSARVRLLLAASGSIAIEIAAPPTPLPGPVLVAVVPLPVPPDDLRLRHKTALRGFYDAARHAAGTAEVVFERPDGALTEGSFTSLFVRRDDRLVTPPLALGLLPGVLRATLIEDGRAAEGAVTRADLGDGFLIGNALRGLMPAVLAPPG